MADSGVQLIEAGWRQGSVLEAPGLVFPYLIRGESDVWGLQQTKLQAGDLLIVVTQSCDIERDDEVEPYVELMRAFWTRDPELLHMARRNSIRHLLVKEGDAGGLILDATKRVFVAKEALLSLTPQMTISDQSGSRMRAWFAARYARPALEDHVITTIQKPIVRQIQKLGKRARVTLDHIEEIRFHLDEGQRLTLLFLRENEVDDVTQRAVESLAGSLVEAIHKAGGPTDIEWDFVSYDNIAASDLRRSVHLPLDHMSPDDRSEMKVEKPKSSDTPKEE